MGEGATPFMPTLLASAPAVIEPVARLLLYLGVVIALGRAFTGAYASPAPNGSPIARRVLVWGGVTALVVAPLLLLQRQLTALDMSLAEAPLLLRESAWGRGWIAVAGSAAWSALLLPFAERYAPSGPWWRIALLNLGAVALAVAMGGVGHAAAEVQWPWIARFADAGHVIGMGGWIGGLLVTWVTTRDGPHARAMATWRAFSRSATVLAPLTLVTGVISSALRLTNATWPAITTSPYAQLLAGKVLIVLIVLAYGARQRQRVHRAQVPPSRAVQQEATFALVALTITAVLTGTEPPSAP